MKKISKFLSIIMTLIMVISIIPMSSITSNATEYSGKCGDNLTWTFNDSTGTLTISGTGAMYDYSYNNRPWESYEDSINKVVINDGVTTIGNYAFFYCSSLTSITIPDSVTSIGYSAFEYCESLTNVTIPDSVTSIGDRVFGYCTGLTSITIPDSVTTIGNSAFSSCDSLTSVTIGDDVTIIGDHAFDYCTSLASITIPDSVEIIGNSAFADCHSLTSVTIGDSVILIDGWAFEGCGSLTSVTIGASVTSIGGWAFDYCTSLTSITVDSNNKYYSSDEYGVLFNKDKTTLIQYPVGNTRISYKIPDSVTTICNDAFHICTSLTSVTIGDSVTSIGGGAFECCDSLTDVYYSGTEAQWNKISIYTYNECLTNATIYYNFTDICGDNLTWDYDELTSTLTISGIGSMYDYYMDCPWECYKNNIEKVIISDGVTTIGRGAFEGCVGLTSLYLPNSVTNVGEDAFADCSSLIDVYYDGLIYERQLISVEVNNSYFEDATWNYEFGCVNLTKHIFDDCFDTVCDTCGKTRTVSHMYEWIIDKDYNCGVDGIKYEECTECHTVRNENTIIPATGDHIFSDNYDTECNVCSQKFVLIQFDSNGGTDISPIRTLPNQAITLPTQTPRKDGYNFVGWSTSRSGEVEYQPYEVIAHLEQSKVLYAQWNKICTSCYGDGKITPTCQTCYGYGYYTVDCGRCNGEGGWYVQVSICSTCSGYGAVCNYCGGGAPAFQACPYCKNNRISVHICSRCDGSGGTKEWRTCYSCSGKGEIKYTCSSCPNSRICTDCSGSGEVIRSNVSAPTVPVIESITSTTIILCTISNGEYSLDGITWQDSPVFENLEEGIEYSFYQRYAKTDTTYPSDASEALIVVAHNHIYNADVTPPTCTEYGSTTYTCECGDTYTEVIEKLEKHNYESVVTAPTCTEQGYTTHICKCGDSYVADYVDALGHTEETIPAVAPTCTETGLTEGANCSVCGETLTEQKELPANGHTPANPVEENYIAPACTENGSKDVVVYCSVCYEEISRETVTLEATGHADNDGDGYCDADNELLDPSVECNHDCHKGGITGFFWKISNFFNKLFRSNKYCECGVAHY